MLIIILSFYTYVVFTKDIVNIKNAVIMLMSVIVLIPVLGKLRNENEIRTSLGMVDIFYYCLCLFCIEQVLKFAYVNINNWNNRLALQFQTFPLGYHHVDFSVIIILTFMLGEKRSHHISSIFLACISLYIIPARTLRLCLSLYVICVILKKYLFWITTHIKAFNTSFKCFCWLIAAVLVFSYVWIFILPRTMIVVDGHEGIYDTSNFERFQTIWDSAVAIIRKHLILGGAEYSNISAYMSQSINLGPHNSFFSVLFFHSVFFGGIYLYLFSKFIDAIWSKDMLPFIIPYLLTACILHNMFIGIWFLGYVVVLLVPHRKVARLCKKD